jgi:penicillin amidase
MSKLLTLLCAAAAFAACAPRDTQPGPAPRVPSIVFAGRDADALWRLPVRERVEVARDAYGIPHIYARNPHDLALVQGYVVARDRFWLMDVFRRLAEGKLSTLVGALPILLDFDQLYRSIQLTDRGELVYEKMYAAMEPQGRELIDAYTAGVNLYLDHAATQTYGARFPPEYNELVLGLLFHPAPGDIPRWTQGDSLAVGRLLQWMLSGTEIDRELRLGAMFAALPPTLTTALVRFRPAVTTATLDGWPGVSPGAPSAPAFRPLTLGGDGLRRFDDLRRAFPGLLWSDGGSNNWVLGPSRSASGNVLVANDPHLILTNPPLFYQVHFNLTEMKGKEAWNAYGVVFPGIPVIMIGRTERVAWGVTVLGYDVMDLYKEELTRAGTAVRRGTQAVPITYSDQRFCHGYSDDCVTRRIAIVPGHGPRIQHDDDFVTFRWTGAEVTQDFKAFITLMTTRDVPESLAAIRDFRVGAMNFVLGDVAGNIAYYGPANVPVRDPRCPQPPYVPLDGASGLCEWTGYIPLDELPRAVNPPAGYLATANNDLVGTTFDNDVTNDAAYYWFDRDAGYRIARIRELLEAKPAHTAADMQRIQADAQSYEGRVIAPYLAAAVAKARAEGMAVPAAVQDAAGYLERWTYDTAIGVANPFTGAEPTKQQVADSVATSIYYTFMRLIKDRMAGDEAAAYGIELPSEQDGYEPVGAARILLHALQDPAAAGFLWDDVRTPGKVETREDVIVAVLDESAAWLADHFKTTDMDAWNWGKLHTSMIFDLYGILGADVRAIGPYPNDGAAGTVDAGTPLFLFGKFAQFGGPVMRMVTELDPKGPKSWNSLPGGQVHDRASPHYDDLAEGFYTNKAFPVPFAKDEVAANLEALTVVLPR